MDDLALHAAALAARHPGAARLRHAGTSRAGTPLWLLSVGHGSRHALVVAGPHANEPVGGATALRLAERLLAGPPPSEEEADITWNFLLCLDPDGARRNEGWLSGPYTLGHYFRHFFRPGFTEQPEWLPDGADRAALPETRTLLALQDELRPFFHCSLHGVDVGGGFVELTRDLPGLAQRVAHTAARLGVPRELGPYDTLYWPSLGPAVYRIPPPRRGDLAAAITEAAVESTWYHPHRYGTVTAVIEAPMWGVPAVGDGSPVADPETFLRTVARTLRHDTRLLDGLLARLRPRLAGVLDAERLLAPVDDYLLVSPGLADSWDPDVHDPAARPLPACDTAHLTALGISGRRVALRTAGLLHRLATAAGPATAELVPRLDALIDGWCTDYREHYGARWIPVARQVEYQSRVVLAACRLAARRPPRPTPPPRPEEGRPRSGEPEWGAGTAVPMHRE
ncbi:MULTISPECIES: M14 family zinc carboxypeptidase [Streptomyces]|uniref:M14 family zinc carboxypeptidase n=1 Tax=Streptomyces TaxID=1883 RepID=UPI003674EECD